MIRNCNVGFGPSLFTIQDICIYLFDHINSVMIDDCSKCTIVTGPVRARYSIFHCNGLLAFSFVTVKTARY